MNICVFAGDGISVDPPGSGCGADHISIGFPHATKDVLAPSRTVFIAVSHDEIRITFPDGAGLYGARTIRGRTVMAVFPDRSRYGPGDMDGEPPPPLHLPETGWEEERLAGALERALGGDGESS